MNHTDKILILGANGMVGKSLVKQLHDRGFYNLLTPRSLNLNLLDGPATEDYITMVKPDYVFMLAARVGGIMANIENPATFGYENALMSLNVINACEKANIKKMLYMGSSCCYPRNCQQPMFETDLLSGTVEPTNEMYALSKIFAIKLCEAYTKQYGSPFITCMPCNIYGPNDNFDLKTSHVMSAMIKKFHDAKIDGSPTVTCFGTGGAKREFLHVDDVTDACIFLMNNYIAGYGPVNIGCGKDISIYDLAYLVKKIVGYKGDIQWDSSKSDGMPRKVLNVDKMINLGWSTKIYLEDGINQTYGWYLKEYEK